MPTRKPTRKEKPQGHSGRGGSIAKSLKPLTPSELSLLGERVAAALPIGKLVDLAVDAIANDERVLTAVVKEVTARLLKPATKKKLVAATIKGVLEDNYFHERLAEGLERDLRMVIKRTKFVIHTPES